MTKRKDKLADDWLDRALVLSQYYYCLCLNKKRFHAQLKRLKVPKAEYPAKFTKFDEGAAVYFVDAPNGNKSAIVCLSTGKRTSRPQIYAMLAHEAVHIWQQHKRYIGEYNPSDEFEAYSIQALSQNLFAAYERQK